ncbi:CASP-like protein 4A [Parasponia andersonii]|uniref:CASP-like protein n=1 Tax=Parasponia andersonii TaxID=3476 RepID=A0A2P5CB97_PARAD|nr:CASP-like protein 4A [Parasponia andersonii]
MEVPKESMQGEKASSLSKSMAKGLPVPAGSFPQQPFPTPSPFSISVASTGWSSRPPINLYSLFLRFLAFLFSFVSALSLVILSPKKKDRESSASSFGEYSELMYCFTITMLAFAYSVFQIFKGILEIADKGIIMSDKVSDYTSFIVDQLLVYLLVSSSSVAISAIKTIEASSPLRKASIISVGFSFATFLVITICALFSGYKLCKRIIW